MKSYRKFAGSLACAAGLVGVTAVGSATPATAASGTWSTTGKAGVHAQGTWWTSGGRLYVSGYVRDTDCNARGAQIKIYFKRNAEAWAYREETVVNTTGCGTNKTFSYNTYRPGLSTWVNIYEGLTNRSEYSLNKTVFSATP